MAPQVPELAVHPAFLVKEIGGLTLAETLKTWTALTTIISVTGIVTTLVVSTVVGTI